MSDFVLRPAEARDLSDITDIWARSFGDPPEFVAALLREAALLPCGLCAEAGGHVRSVMFAFEGQSLSGHSAAYLYALCTHPGARGRGMGTAVVRALARQCFDRGTELVFLSPASRGLADWYAAILGTAPLCAFTDEAAACSDGGVCVPIGAAEYFAHRRSDVGVSRQLLTAQSVLHRQFGGGFFRIDTADCPILACAEPAEHGILLRELLCPPQQRALACGAVAAYYGADRVFLRRTAGIGCDLVYIKIDHRNRQIPELLEIPSFFYTLD